MAMRAVAWPPDMAAVALSLAQAENWFWLDGSAPDPEGTRGRSYIGSSNDVLHARAGGEQAFLEVLRTGLQNDEAWVAAFSYEFGVALMGQTPVADTASPAFAICMSTVLVLDHAARVAELWAPSDADIDAWLAQHGHTLRPVPVPESALAAVSAPAPVSAAVSALAAVPAPEFLPGPTRPHLTRTSEIFDRSERHPTESPRERESPREVRAENSGGVPSGNSGVVPSGNSGVVPSGNSDVVPSGNSDVVPDGAVTPSDTAQVTWRASDDEYLQHIDACKRAIRDGEAYVLCLTDMAESSARGVDPLRLFMLLRDGGAATRGGVIVSAGRALVSASPERFLSVKGRTVTTHPIKGTRPRGETPQFDEALATDLVSDPKERAENLMIVDLMRNDLSRVCVPGTVATTGFLRVESHSRVHQLVSTVSGTLRDQLDVTDALLAMFPGGSMTGAPKQRAVELLAEFELGARGLYSGCFGVLTRDSAELAMSIRSIELRSLGTARPIALVGAGGGITSDSVPVAELAEKHLKAGPLLTALAALQSE